MKYIVPKKDQINNTSFSFSIDVSPSGRTIDIILRRTLEDEVFEECSSHVMECIAKRLQITGLQGNSLYAEIRNRIQFED